MTKDEATKHLESRSEKMVLKIIPLRKAFIASFEFDQPALTLVDVLQETDKAIYIDPSKETPLIGVLGLPNRITKAYYHLFDTLEEAVDWFIGEHQKAITRKNGEIQALEKSLQNLIDVQITLKEHKKGDSA